MGTQDGCSKLELKEEGPIEEELTAENSEEITKKLAVLLKKFQENRLSIKKSTQELGALNAIIQGKS